MLATLFLEQLGVSAKPDVDALRIVKSVHAEQHGLRVSEVPAKLRCAFCGFGPSGNFIETFDVDGNGECTHMRFAAAAVCSGDFDDVAVGWPPEQTFGHGQEVAGTAGGLESHKVSAEDSQDDWSPPRQLQEEVGCWKRDVKEETDPQVGSQ